MNDILQRIKKVFFLLIQNNNNYITTIQILIMIMRFIAPVINCLKMMKKISHSNKKQKTNSLFKYVLFVGIEISTIILFDLFAKVEAEKIS